MAERSILVAEDDDAIRGALADMLRSAGYGVAEARDGEEALMCVLTKRVDLVLLDLNMPKINGFKLLRIMTKECPGVPSIIITAYGEEKERVKGLEEGADDYVVKPFSMAELSARITAVLRRASADRLAGKKNLQFSCGHLVPESRCVQMNDGRIVVLREKEYELFHYLLTHAGRVVAQGELLLRVWGSRSLPSETRTVAVTLARLREKLGPEVADCIENVRGRGYRWKDS